MAELIREKLLMLTSEEIPHSLTVVIEELEKTSEDLITVGAVIYTERESQKGIIIGKNGSMLKKVGQLARKEIENRLGSKIYLRLWVKVKKDWRNRPEQLKNLGYSE